MRRQFPGFHAVAYFNRLIDLTTRHRQETEMETERLRTAQYQAERTLEARERAHRQRVKGLEEQVHTYTHTHTQCTLEARERAHRQCVKGLEEQLIFPPYTHSHG